MRGIATIAALAALSLTGWAAEVRLADTAAVDHGLVLLADVASINSSDAALRGRLANVPVGYVGDGAETAVVDADSVKTALSNAGVNVAGITLSGAMAARVTRGPDALESAKVIGGACANAARPLRAVVTKHRVVAGQMLTPEDLEVKSMSETAAAAAGAVQALNLAVGRRLVATCEAGKPVLAGNLKNENTIKRGDAVVLKYTDGPLTITVETTAMQDAGDGDRVRLRRADGRTEVVGKVVGPGRAVPVTGGQG